MGHWGTASGIFGAIWRWGHAPLLQRELEPETLQTLRTARREFRRHLGLPPRQRQG